MLINIFELLEKNNFLIREMNKVTSYLTKSLKGHSQYIEKGSI